MGVGCLVLGCGCFSWVLTFLRLGFGWGENEVFCVRGIGEGC